MTSAAEHLELAERVVLCALGLLRAGETDRAARGLERLAGALSGWAAAASAEDLEREMAILDAEEAEELAAVLRAEELRPQLRRGRHRRGDHEPRESEPTAYAPPARRDPPNHRQGQAGWARRVSGVHP